MRLTFKKIAGLSLTALCVIALGCDNGPGTPAATSSKEKATVSGTVTIKGLAATGGEVVFDPSNVNRKDAPIVTAKIGPNGAYTVETLVGENYVTVKGPQIKKEPMLAGYRKLVDVKAGENAVPITLP